MLLQLVKKLDEFISGIEISASLNSIPVKTTVLRRNMANLLETEGTNLVGKQVIENAEWDRIITCAKNLTKNRAERQTALDKLLSFAKDANKNTLFTINKERFCIQLLIRILDPNKIDQGMLGMCGPTTVVGTIIKRRPDLYAEGAIELATTKTTSKLGTMLTIPADFKSYDYFTGKCPEVDWVFLLALKDSSFWAEMVMNPKNFGVCTLDDMYKLFEKVGLFTSIVWVEPNKIVKTQGGLLINGNNAKERFDHAGVLVGDKSVTVVIALPGQFCKQQLNIHPNDYNSFKADHLVILKKMEFSDILPVLGPMNVKLQISTWTYRMTTGNIPTNAIYQSYGGYIAAKM